MAPRPYRSALRAEAQQETVRRIVVATVELHADRGAVATSHGDIAERAGVSVPTVYKHFPTRAALLPHCMGMVQAEAPTLDLDGILATAAPAARIARFVEGVHARHAFFAPWMRWAEVDAAGIPEFAQALAREEDAFRATVRQVLGPLARGRGAAGALAVAQALLGFGCFRSLERELADRAAIRRAVTVALQRLFPSTDPKGDP